MNASLPFSASRWEQAFFTFLRVELAPSATRWRDALRLTLLCAVATTIVLAYHLPYGEFLIIFFFAVSQPDAWASLRKARLRGIGTLIGGTLAIVGIIACADKPWLFLVGQAFLFAVAMFLSRTTTIPYVVILAMFTFVIATPAIATDPEAGLDKVFWRILLTSVGAVVGTVAQLVLWPEHPEKLLLRQLAERLVAAEAILNRVATDADAVKSTAAAVNASVSIPMAGQLDLLASAEAGSRWLQQRHSKQIKLITEIEMILITALRLERLAGEDPETMRAETTRVRLQEVRHQLALVHRTLVERSLPAPTFGNISPAIASEPVEDKLRPALSAISELERIVKKMPDALAFLEATPADWHAGHHALAPIREPIAERTIFTPACRLSNVEAVRFALKGALAATICYVLYQALNWPGISTCVVTALICAQSSFGAGLQKSWLRLVGATVGGLAAVAVVVIFLPNLEGAASFITVASILFFAASWLTVGSNRISYIGLQAGLVVALVLLNQPNQAIDLSVAGDRILGVLLGITVMGFIDLTLWPNFAGSALRPKLAETLRALAMIPRHTARQAWDEAGTAALAVHRQIAAALALYNEWQLEFGFRKVDDDLARRRMLTFINDLEEVFRAQLVVLRERRGLVSATLSSVWCQRAQALDEAIVQYLEALAEPTGKPTTDASRLLANSLDQLQPIPALGEMDLATRGQISSYALVCHELANALQRPGGTPRHARKWPSHRHLTTGCPTSKSAGTRSRRSARPRFREGYTSWNWIAGSRLKTRTRDPEIARAGRRRVIPPATSPGDRRTALDRASERNCFRPPSSSTDARLDLT